MQTHLTTIRDIVDELASIGVVIKDEELAIIALCSLPNRFDSLIVSMESRPANEITFDYVSNRLLGEYHRQSETSPSSPSSESGALLATKSKFKSVPCTHCNRPGHSVQKCWDKYPEQRPAHHTFFARDEFGHVVQPGESKNTY
jgi:hypothetical protein